MKKKRHLLRELRIIVSGCSLMFAQAAKGQNDGVQGTAITATVPSTLALTANNGGTSNAWVPPQDLTFSSANRAAPADLTQSFPGTDFDSPSALVLLKTATIDVPIVVRSSLGALKTIVVRNPDDVGPGTTNLPTYTPAPNGGTIKPTERGSFYIVAFKDTNSDGTRNAGETAYVLPLLIVSAEYINNTDASAGDTTDFQYNQNYPARYLIESLGNGGSIGLKPDNTVDGRFGSLGAGYNAIPSVAFTPSTNGASATATLNGDSVNQLQFGPLGTNFADLPIVTIDPPTGPWSKSEVAAGSFPVFGGMHPAIKYDAKITLVGGGAGGSLGTDRVYGGWSQQLQATDQHANYQNGANIQTDSLRLKQNYAFPFLDRSTAYDAGTGAGTILTTGSKYELQGLVAGTLGRKAHVTGWDSLAFNGIEKELAGSFVLAEIRLQAKFRVFLTIWTNPTAGMTPSRPLGGVLPNPNNDLKAGERTYFDVRAFDWEVDSLHAIDTSGVGTRQGQPKSERSNKVTFSPISPALTNQHETRPPRANDGIERVTQ